MGLDVVITFISRASPAQPESSPDAAEGSRGGLVPSRSARSDGIFPGTPLKFVGMAVFNGLLK